jgi:hypothetical protein
MGSVMVAETQRVDDDLAAVLSIEDERSRVENLINLAPRLSEEQLSQALLATETVRDESLRALALEGLAPALDQNQLDTALKLSMTIGLRLQRNKALGSIGRHVSEGKKTTVIRIIQDEPDRRARLAGWIGLAPYLPGELKEEAISTALSLADDWERAEALVALAPHLPYVSKIKALNSARGIYNHQAKVHALSGLLPALPNKERADALEEALNLTLGFLPEDLIEATAKLLPQMPAELKPELLAKAVQAAVSVPNAPLRVGLLIKLAGTLPLNERNDFLLNTFLRTVEDVVDEKERGEALIALGRAAPGLQSSILSAAGAITDAKIKSRVIIQLQGIAEQEVTSPTPPEAKPASSQPSRDSSSSAIEAGIAQAITKSPEMESVAVGEAPEPQPLEIPAAKRKSAASRSSRKKAAKAEVPPASPQEPQLLSEEPVKAQVVPEPPPKPPLPSQPVGVKTYLHSDKWTLDDQLNYSLYADAIAEFIRHTDTHPPLAIGVLAPWGQGKTTLMKLIQNQLETKAKADDSQIPKVASSIETPGIEAKTQEQKSQSPPIDVAVASKPLINFAYLRQWLRDPVYNPPIKKLNYPTVWFNAWKYQNTEQLWAGMAHCILSQLVSQMNSQFERERFWLALQAERIDFNAIRRDIHRVVFERVAPWIAIWAAVGVVGLLVFSFGAFTGLRIVSGTGMATVTLSSLMTIVHWLWARTKVDKTPLEGKFAQYIRQPTYEGKLGFFHEVEQDVQRVFRLLIDKEKPVVVFIDDLDRCSPGTVALVIEAMNLFLSADFPDCYFVVGMDAQVVAASMEVAYENLDRKLKSVTRSYGSLGWYFMDKFIQLQFNIPNMTPDQRSTYLTKLLGQERDKEMSTPEKVLDDVQKQLQEKLQSDSLNLDELPHQAAELAKLRHQRPQIWQALSHSLIETGARKLTNDSPALQEYLKRYEQFLGSSPRGIKRFANLYRFYSLSQLSRQSQDLRACSPSALARWLVIMLRWPQVVRWIQWGGDGRLSSDSKGAEKPREGTSAFTKASELEEQLGKAATHEAWLDHLAKVDPNQMEWLQDEQLYEFLKSPASADEKLSVAVETGVW